MSPGSHKYLISIEVDLFAFSNNIIKTTYESIIWDSLKL